MEQRVSRRMKAAEDSRFDFRSLADSVIRRCKGKARFEPPYVGCYV
jgi:hypothetical protein